MVDAVCGRITMVDIIEWGETIKMVPIKWFRELLKVELAL